MRNLAVTHNNQFSILLFNALLQTLLGQKYSGIYLLLQLLKFYFTHTLYILHI